MATSGDKQKSYYYRFDTSTALGKRFRSFWNELMKAERAADKFAAKVGAKTFYPNMRMVAGGVDAVSFPDGVCPNLKVWRSIGKDGDGMELWVPNVKQRRGTYQIPEGGKCPSHTANRIFSRKPNDKGEVKFIELYRDDDEAKSTDRRFKLSWAAKESIRIEKQRLLLPTISATDLLRVLSADVAADVPDDDQLHIVRIITPEMFEWRGYYYLNIAYPCRDENMEAIANETYRVANVERMQAERAMQEMEKLNEEGN